VASPALRKQPSAKKEQQGANSTEGTRAGSCHHWGTLDSSILDQIHEGVIATDVDANITGGNHAVLQMYGYSPEELIGKNLALLYPEEERVLLHGAAIASVEERGHHRAELRTRSKSGNDVYVHLSLALLTDKNYGPAGMVAILVDITERKLLEFALKQNQGKHNKAAGPDELARGEKPDLVSRQINDTEFLMASPLMHKFMAMVDRVAAHPEIVLITGETGSGKELIARSIHDNSPRRSRPWVDINCAALPEQLVESELFGYEKGAFSGADSSKPGLFELADKGTLFLDEIGELDLKLQVKLLRVLDGTTYYRLGGHRKITVDVRIVAATNQDLEVAVAEGRFRRDLFHRLSQIQLRVPPLRERPEDVVALSQYFLALKDSRLTFSSDALSALACYSWPGNVRELRNLIARLAMGSTGAEITADDLLAEISVQKQRQSAPSIPATNLEGMEEQMIIKALENTGGHRGLAAEQLGISRRTLSRKLREYEITCSEDDRGRSLGIFGCSQPKFFRAKTQFLVSLKNSEGNEINVTGVNLSSGGLGVDGLTDPQRFGGLLDASFLLPETENLIQAKVRVVWADASGRAGIRFVVLEPALYEEIHHWTERKMKDEGWELPQ
jgi:PAS domain S-box-containing protein